jgi:membrane-associated phospholipid phosphatase
VIVIGVVLCAALIGGATAWLAVGHWPHVDPAAPRVSATTISRAMGRRERLRSLLHTRFDPATATGLALSVALLAVAAGGLGVGVVLFMVRTNTGFARWDRSAAEFGAQHATTVSTDALRALTQFGGTAVVVLLAVVVAVTETWRTRRAAVVAFLVAVLGGVSILFNATKWLVNRSRPDIDRLVGFAGPSFPSGHAATAAAAYTAFALLLGRGRSRRTKQALAAGAAALTAAVAATRVLLGVHWLTDVIAGIGLGWAWFALCSIAFGGRLLRFGAPVAMAEGTASDVTSG